MLLGGLMALPLRAQIPVVIFGTVQDAVSKEPIAGALLLNRDSTNAVFTDSLGNFAIELQRGAPYVLHAEQFGYERTRFELSDSSRLLRSILLVNPDPIPIEGVTVVAEDALTELLEQIEGRRGGYSGSVRFYDRERILAYGGDSAFELVRRFPFVDECRDDWMELCRRAGLRSGRLLVCINERRTFASTSELSAIPLESVALAEFYGPTVGWGLSRWEGGALSAGGQPPFSSARRAQGGQIRIYTREWIVSTAGRGIRGVFPAEFGC